MDSKAIRKNTGRFFAWVGLNISSLIVKVLPGRCLYGFAEGIAAIGYRIAAKQRRIAMESLEIAFAGEKSAEEKKRIARDCVTFMAKAAVELMFLLDRPDILKERVSFDNKQVLDAAFARGKGVILVSAHFGNFPLMMARIGMEGHKLSGIMRPMRDERVEKFFFEKRSHFNIKTIYSQPRRACVEESIRVLRSNGALFIPIDQNFGTGGVFVRFFNRQAATATGPVVLARRTQAALIPCFIIRQPDNTNRIVFEPPLDLKEGASDEETITINIQRLTDIIESYIRRYPAQWGWIHRRWKTKPN